MVSVKPQRAEKGGHPQQAPSSRTRNSPPVTRRTRADAESPGQAGPAAAPRRLSAHGPGRGASPRHLLRRSLGAGAAGAARSHGQAREQDTSGAVSGKARFPRGQPSAAGPAPRGELKGFPRGALSAGPPPPPGPARAVSSHRHTHRGRCRSRPHCTSGFQEGGGAPKPLSQPLPRGRCRWRHTVTRGGGGPAGGGERCWPFSPVTPPRLGLALPPPLARRGRLPAAVGALSPASLCGARARRTGGAGAEAGAQARRRVGGKAGRVGGWWGDV